MDSFSILIFAGALLVAAGSPGPSIAALVARVINRGTADVLPFLAAMWIGEAIWLGLAVWGLAALAETFHAVFTILRWLGIAYLLWLAWTMWQAPSDARGKALPDQNSASGMFAAGILVTLGNPKIMVFYLALLPTIIDLGDVTAIAWLELTLTMLAVLILVDLAWCLLAARARVLLKSAAAIRVTNRLSAGVMAAAAAAIAVRQ